MEKRLSVAFLWHMHQPLYKDLLTGKYYLPWVRLHSTYSYLDMVSILEDFPEIRGTFNFTPSLICQIKDFSENRDQEDVFLSLSRKKASELEPSDKAFLLKNFFSCDPKNAIQPFKKYAKLLSGRGKVFNEEALIDISKKYSEGDFLDLQVFFNLAWCGFTLRENDPLIKDLVRKGGDFTEGEKQALLDKQKEVVASILPLYKKLQDEGRIEISTSPYYHPILPLLCKGNHGKGYDYSADAKIQVSKAIDLYEKVFGRKPIGMWPSEGSVSPEIIPILADAGIKWIATDEGILLESFKGEDVPREELIYRSFTAENAGRKIDMVFRDINLSNAVSFKYSHMPPDKAAYDLLSDINAIRKARQISGGEHIVNIILDGENPWPYFPDGGKQFLSKLYSGLTESPDLKTYSIGGYLSEYLQRKEIHSLYSGSWIDRNFNKWIGSPQKDKAWEYLDKTRKELFAVEEPPEEALEELYVAEGSDWFWWYDDFGTEINFIFDDLFRMHLSNIYKILGKRIPHYLTVPIMSGPGVKKIPEILVPSEMARFNRILLVSSEVYPFAKTGGLADVCGSLPRALVSLGCEVRVIMPFYSGVKDAGLDIELESRKIKHPLLESMFGFDLYVNKADGISTYFVSNKKYFAREGLYGSSKGDYSDNALRFAFFDRAVLAAIKAINYRPDVIHCNDWQTALIPFYLRFKLGHDTFYRNIKTLFTIHNMAYQGIFDKTVLRKIGIPDSFFNMNDLEFFDKVNFMKSGILYSDAINTVSHKYAEEIMTTEYGASLDGLMRSRKDYVYGIPNGVDYSIWSPRNDFFIKENYDAETLHKKRECKKDLIEDIRLSIGVESPLIGFVGRLAYQKGVDLFAEIVPEIIKLGAGVVILGSGDSKYINLFKELMAKYPGKIYMCNDFNDELAHKIESGSDIFIMPSRYEPCGLNQMYSIKYGTVPVVRATGGLDDVIVDYDEDPENGNGFKFGPSSSEALLAALERAIILYHDKTVWDKIMKQGMICDFSWAHSAEQYLKLYRKIIL